MVESTELAQRNRPMKATVALARQAISSTEARVVVSMGVLAVVSSVFALLTARWLGPGERGVVVVFMTTSTFLMLAGSFGVSTASRVLLNGSPPLNLMAYLRQARRLGGLHIVTSASVGMFVLAVAGGLPSLWVGLLFVPFATLQLHCYLQREALHGLGRHNSALAGDIVAFTLQTAVVIALHMSGRLTLAAACITLVAGSAVEVMFLSARLRSAPQTGPFAALTLWHLIRYSLPAMVTTLGQAFVIRGDRLVLGALAGSAAVGVYGVAATFSELLWLVPGGVAEVVFRRASMGRTTSSGATSRLVALLVTAVGCVALAALTSFLIPALLGDAYRSAVPLAYILIAAALPMGSYQLDVAALNGVGRLKDGSVITMVGSAVLLLGCLVSIPQFGAYGAAWSSFVSYFAMAAIARVQVRRAAVPVRSEPAAE